MNFKCSRQTKGILTVAGGCICQLALSVFYLWTSIVVYATSYFRQWDDSLTLSFTQGIFPLQGICLALAMPFGKPVADKIGAKTTMLLSYIMIIIGLISCSYLKNFYVFALVYSITLGACGGLTLTIPLWAGWKHYPNKKGLVSGIIVSGFGLGAVFFGLAAQYVVNPDNILANIQGSNPIEKFFDENVYRKVPFMLRIMSIIVAFFGIISIFMIQPLEDNSQINTLSETSQDSSQQTDRSIDDSINLSYQLSFQQIIRSRCFWQLFFMALLSVSGTFYVASSYKSFGYRHSDLFLTIVGGSGMTINGISRFGWGIMMDHVSFKMLFGLTIIVEVAMISTFSLIETSGAMFTIWFLVILACEGAHFSIFPTICSKMFGIDNGPKVYGLIALALNLGSLLQYILALFLQSTIHFAGLFYTYSVLAIMALLILLTFNQSVQFHKTPEILLA